MSTTARDSTNCIKCPGEIFLEDGEFHYSSPFSFLLVVLVVIGAVDSGDNRASFRGGRWPMAVDSSWETMGRSVWIGCGLCADREPAVARIGTAVDDRTQPIQWIIHAEYTFCPQLYIEALLNFGYMLTDCEVEFDRFFDLFDRMNGGSVVFSAKFGGDFWKAQVQLAPQKVHGNLSR